MQSLVKVFGENVRKLRISKGFSQEKFAESCGLHRTYISAVERGRRSIALKNIEIIALALEVEPYQLLKRNAENCNVK